MGKITTTAHSILGLLSIRSQSTYQLAQHMVQSNLRAIWPRAESRIYEVPKGLARKGLVDSEVQSRGDRQRTVYRVNRKGRNALRKWLGEPSARFRYRSEAMVKLSLADLGTLDDLQRNIESIRREALEDAEAFFETAQQVCKAGPPLPERTHVNALVDEFILELIESRIRWVRFAQSLTRDWKTAAGDEASMKQGDEWWQETSERLKRLLADEYTPTS